MAAVPRSQAARRSVRSGGSASITRNASSRACGTSTASSPLRRSSARPGSGRGRGEQAQQLAAHALGRDAEQRPGRGGQRGLERGVDLERQLRDDPCGAQRAQRILGEPLLGAADRAEPMRRQVREPAVGIDRTARHGIEGDRVQR